MRPGRALGLAAAALLLAACGSTPHKGAPSAGNKVEPPATAGTTPRRSPYAPAQEDPSKRGNYTRGGLYAPEIQDSV
ncbi:MAG: septal ring lytic transglycosylase RlpA family protein, partial [Lysobacteraceae bacterium]